MQGPLPREGTMGIPKPLGTCWCGCGQDTSKSAFFVSGHDKVAEAAVVIAEYGSVAKFLAAHGYGPGQKNPRRTYDTRDEPPVADSQKIQVRYGGGVQYPDRDVVQPVPRLIVYRDGDYWCPVDALLSGVAYHLVVQPALGDGAATPRLRNLLAQFAALHIKDAIKAGVLPHEQTDRVQRIGVSSDTSPAQGVNFVVSVDHFIEYARSTTDAVLSQSEGDVMQSFTLDW